MAAVELRGIRLGLPGAGDVLGGVDLEVGSGELLTLLGPSGCGKTSLLRVIAGLAAPSAGTVLIDGEDVTGWPPERRDVAYVPQTGNLLPHRDVAGNLAFPLQVRGASRAFVDERVSAEAGAHGLRRLLRRLPATLSQGQRRAVSLGRATTRTPRVLLLDEPLAQLDATQRAAARAEVVRMVDRLGVTTLWVTNEPAEALLCGHRVAVLRQGVIEQVDTPQMVAACPASTFVAEVAGDPPMNFVPADLEVGGRRAWLRFGAGAVAAPQPLPVEALAFDDHRVLVGVRPEAIREAGTGTGPESELDAAVVRAAGLGSHREVIVRLAAAGGEVTVLARMPPGPLPERGTRIRLVLPAGALHGFDPLTGRAIWHPPATRG